MASVVVTDIASLVTNDPENGSGGLLGEITDAAMVIDNGRVAWLGKNKDAPTADRKHSVAGRSVIPGFVDSHAHLIFAGDRAAEFDARMRGVAYSAGGIATTVAATRAASDDELRANYRRLTDEMLVNGITTFEAKSGYGLDLETELRALRIAAELTEETTFLGAHVVPQEYAGAPESVAAYVELVCGEMLTAVRPHAKWIDVFCDRGAFTVDQARQILTAGKLAGLQPRIHANQLEAGDAIKLAVELDCASADHCTHLSDEDVELLAASSTVATLLPGAEFSTRSPYPDARRLIDSGAKVAIATDCNPGSSYTTSMPFCLALAVREMNFSPAEAIHAATAGGAAALRRSDVGHLGIGARADFVELNASSYLHLAYRPGVNLIHKTHRGRVEE